MKRNLGFDECPECGGHDLETETKAPEGQAMDGDSVRCRECGQTGTVSCDSETDPYINWHDYPEPTVDNRSI